MWSSHLPLRRNGYMDGRPYHGVGPYTDERVTGSQRLVFRGGHQSEY